MHGRVIATQQLTPSLVRVELGEGDLASFTMPEATDAYVNVALPPAGAPYDAVFDPREVKAEHPEDTWPARRRYTVRSWDPSARRLVVDFVVHGDVGVAGPWATAVQPGGVLVFEGPERRLPSRSRGRLAPARRRRVRAARHRRLARGPASGRSRGRAAASATARTTSCPCPARGPSTCSGCTGPAARATPTSWPTPCGPSTSVMAGCMRSCTARPTRSAPSAGTCSPSVVWGAPTCPARRTGAATMTDEAWRQVKRDYVAAMEAEVA